MDRKIFFTQFYKVLRNDGQVVIGGIADNGKWMSFDENDLECNIKNLSIDLTSKSDMKQKNRLTGYGKAAEMRMSKELLVNIIRWAEENGIESITFTGENINLLPNMNDIMSLVKQNFSGQVDIITNEMSR